MVDNYRKRQAILCGVSQYSRPMAPLPSIAQEIPVIADALSNKLHESYRYQVKSYLNQQVTLNNLPSIFFLYKQNSLIDELLLYFAGHGTIYKGEPYFVTYGAESNNPGIKLSDLAIEINSLHSGIKEIFLILNFCYSGSFLQPSNLETINQIFSQRTAILTATRNDQLGKTKNQDGKSFANYFVEALTNSLPDKNGHISFGKLALYVSEQMQSSYTQSPVFYAPALSGHPINKVNKKILLPHPRNRFFTGRVEALSSIDAALSNNNSAVITQAQAISGMGGIGKTQTALEFCYRQIYNNSYQTILWVNAETEASFNNSYYDIVDLLNLASSNGTLTSDGASNQGLKVDEVISLVKRWLANNPNWLIVLDNLENPKLINQYLPSNHQGHVLITTRSSPIDHAAIVPLNKMSLETATLFLLKRAYPDEVDINAQSLQEINIDSSLLADAQQLAKAIDGLPLALKQAAAFIYKKCSFAEYLTFYQQALADKTAKNLDDHDSVFITFNLAFDRVKKESLTSAKLLEVCSFLDSDLIPEEIFTQAGNFFGDELAKLQNNIYEFNKCLDILVNYSLIERDTNNKSLSIHRLVQTVIRELIGEDNKKLLVDSLAKALSSLSHDDTQDPDNWPKYQRLLPSVTCFFEFAKLYQSNAVETAYLFNHLGIYCNKQALFALSLSFYNLALNTYKHLFSNNHPSVAQTLNNIGEIYRQQGNYSLALDHFNLALTIYKNSVSFDYLRIAQTLSNIGLIYQTQAKYPEALDHFNLALTIYKNHFDDNHPDIVQIFNNIGLVYKEQGNYSDALYHFNLALTISKHHFDDNHPSVANILNNIGLVYKEQGNYSDALYFFNQSLNIYKHHFGDYHPDVAIALTNIGEVYRQQGNYSQALDHFNLALTIYKNHFGDYHPSVATALTNIANIYQTQGKHQDALHFYNQSLNIYKHHFGDYHPDVARTISNIGGVYQAQGNYPLALNFFNQALAIRKRFFGDYHLSVANTLTGVGETYRQQGNYPMALEQFNQSLTIKKLHFGDYHPDVALSLWGLASVYIDTNQQLEAANYYQQAIEIFDKFFPPKHPWVVQLLNQYSQLLLKLNKPDEAQPLLDRLASLKQSP